MFIQRLSRGTLLINPQALCQIELIFKKHVLIVCNQQAVFVLGTGFEPVISRMKISRPRPARRTEHRCDFLKNITKNRG